VLGVDEGADTSPTLRLGDESRLAQRVRPEDFDETQCAAI
jgi:hypothetical protein